MPDVTLSESELAARFGFAMAVLNSNAELKSLFDKAVANSYTADRFQAELRATNWYQSTSENFRNYQVLQASDPASYQAQLEQLRVRVQMMAAELGANIGPLAQGDTGGMINHFFAYGYDDNQIRDALSSFVKYTDGRLIGQAGQYETELRDYANKMGVTLSDDTILSSVRNVIGGKQTIDDAYGNVRKVATSAFPHLADRIAAGETLADIADPYRQSMAQLLELNPDAVTLQDPTIRSALATANKDGQPILQTLYDFQNTVRQDQRWLKTANARDSAMSVTNRVLRDMGVIS